MKTSNQTFLLLSYILLFVGFFGVSLSLIAAFFQKRPELLLEGYDNTLTRFLYELPKGQKILALFLGIFSLVLSGVCFAKSASNK